MKYVSFYLNEDTVGTTGYHLSKLQASNTFNVGYRAFEMYFYVNNRNNIQNSDFPVTQGHYEK